MRKIAIIFSIFVLGCGNDNKNNSHAKLLSSSRVDSQTSKDTIKRSNIIVRRSFFVGDVNNDKKSDSAFVEYGKRIRTDGTIEKECSNKNCDITITFNNGIPDLIIDQSLGIYIKTTDDLNNDKANEITVFSEWFEGYWYNISVWTLKNASWEKIANTKAMLSEDKDYENRIIKKGSQFYLVGDGWDNNKGGLTERAINIKIKK